MWRNIERRRMSSYGRSIKDGYINGLISLMDDSFEFASNYDIILHQTDMMKVPSTPYDPSTPSTTPIKSTTPNKPSTSPSTPPSTPNDPSSKDGFREIEVRIVSRVKNSSVVTDDIRGIIFRNPYYEVNKGDYFKFENEVWICTSTNTSSVPKSCVVERVNNIARIYDRLGNFHEIPCILKGNMRLLDEEKYLSLPDNTLQMRVKYTPEVASLITVSPITRFIFNGHAYRVESVDNITDVDPNGRGIMSILLKSDLLNTYDDVIGGIADRYRPRNIDLIIENGQSVEISLNDQLQLDITVKVDGEVIFDPNLKFRSSNNDVVMVDSNGLIVAVNHGFAQVSVEFNGVLDDIYIEVVEEVSDSYSIIIDGDDFVYINREKTFKGVVMNNSVEASDKEVVWKITDLNGEDTQLATIIPKGLNVVVKANKDNLTGRVLLICELKDDPYIVNEKEIEVRSII